MKKAIRILLTAALCIAVAVAVTVFTFAEDPKGTVAEASALLDAFDAAGNTESKMSAMLAVRDYLQNKPIDSAEAGYDAFTERYEAAERALTAAGFAYAQDLLSAFDANATALDMHLLINRVRYAVRVCRIDGSVNGYGAFAAGLTAAEETFAAAFAAARAELTGRATVADLEKAKDAKSDKSYDFSDGATAFTVANRGANVLQVSTEENGNRYLELVVTDPTVDTFIRIEFADPTQGMVFEWDLTTFDTFPTTYQLTSGVDQTYYPKFFSIRSGNLCSTDGTVLKENVITPGEWIHVTMVYYHTDKTYDVYLDYEYLGHYEDTSYATVLKTGKDYKLTTLRCGAAKKRGSFAMDNIVYYRGTSVKDVAAYQAMSPEERMVFYISHLSDERYELTERMTCYDKARELLPDFYDEENASYLTQDEAVRAAVDVYLSYDPAEMLAAIRRVNLEKLQSIVGELESMERLASTAAARAVAAASAQTFAAENDMDTSSPLYLDLISRLDRQVTLAESDMYAKEFIVAVNKFSGALSISAKQSIYNAVVEAHEKITGTTLNDPALAEALAAFEHIPAQMEAATRVYNSESFLYYTEKLAPYPDEQAWEENYEYLEVLVLRCRRILQSEMYDPKVEGFAAAYEIYRPVGDYFWAALQAKHIQIMSAQVEKYLQSDSYIEKFGVCVYLEKYFATHAQDIDPDNEGIQVIAARLEQFRQELDNSREEYGDLLYQNTVLLCNTVDQMRAASDFDRLEELYNSALEYYYAMNLTDEQTREKVAVYEAYGLYIESVHEGAVLFRAAAATLSAAEGREQVYAALVDCYRASLSVDATMDAIAAEYAVYTAAYDAYTAEAGRVNGEGAVVRDIICNVRVPYVPAAVLLALRQFL